MQPWQEEGGPRHHQFPAVPHSPSVPPRNARELHAAHGSRTQSSLPPGWRPALHPRGTSGTARSPRAAARTGTCGSGLQGQRCVHMDQQAEAEEPPAFPWNSRPSLSCYSCLPKQDRNVFSTEDAPIFPKHWDKCDVKVTEEHRTFYNNKYKKDLYILTYKMLQDPA